MAEAISDEAVAQALCRYAGLAARLLDDPSAWLGEDDVADDGAAEHASPPERLGRSVRDRLTGDVHPGSSAWASLPVDRRSRWWVDRVKAVAAPVAATPRVFGLAADRLPLQAAFGAAAQGLAVCAVAREHGVTEPSDWVPLLGRVLFDRDLPHVTAADVAPQDDAPDDDGPEDDAAEPPPRTGPLRRGTRALWRLARSLLALGDVFDDRPRGALPWRMLGKVPVVGLAGGVLDERGGVSRAAREAARLLGPR